MTTWRERAHSYIATLNIPPGATLKETRRIFREKGSAFHGGTQWGRRAWGQATRQFQRGRGLLPPLPSPTHQFPADIIFPFRGLS